MSTISALRLGIYLSVIVSFLLLCCNTQNAVNNDLDGWWEQEGYGIVFEVKEDEVILYHISASGCAIEDTFFIKDFASTLTLVNDTLFQIDGINKYCYTRIDDSSVPCNNDDDQNLDPLYNFDFLWSTFQENYCYFDERNVDWFALKDKYRSQLTTNSSNVELYKVLHTMTEELNDGHVGISADDETEEAYENEEEQDDTGPGTIAFIDLGTKLTNANVENPNTYHKGIVNWGEIEDSILYLQVNSMFLMANYNLSDTLEIIPFVQTYFGIAEESVDHDKNEVKGINKLMTSIISKKEYRACILDVRFNGGGHDEVGLEIMSFFTDRSYRVGEKKAYYKNNWTKPVNIKQHHAEQNIDGPIVVLTSHLSASATEILTMSALAHPNATIIGSKTEGIFSDMLDKVLPNGWNFSLSNEVYLDHKGINHEAVGINPDIKLDYSTDDKLFYESMMPQDGVKDAGIAKAVEVIGQSD